MATWNSPRWLLRLVALTVALVGVPLVLSVSAFFQDSPIRPGETSPRTVIAPELIRVSDPDATQRARRQAAEDVPPILRDDNDARAAIVNQVRDAFAAAAEVRGSEGDPGPSAREQADGLREILPMVSEEGLVRLTELGDSQLAAVANQAEDIAQGFAIERIGEDDVETYATQRLSSELATRSFPPDIAEEVVRPIITDALRPTVEIDEEETAARREEVASSIEEVAATFTRGQPVVTVGEEVTDLQFAALRARGLEGAEPWRVLARAAGLVAAVVLAVCLYLRAYRQHVWASTRRVVLLSLMLLAFAVALQAMTLLTPPDNSVWLFILPVGALAMLATILFDPPIGVLLTVPTTALVAFVEPGEPELIAFAAVASLASVPLVSRLSASRDLRRAALHSTVGYGALAALCVGVFDLTDANVLLAAGVGALNGVVTALIVNGSLPFLESVFSILTATSLLNLADRNHPLLRELEQKALGSYNHSIMVSTMVERAARAIDADALLGSVAALYHDIGKVRRPYFFVENQFGVDNPHDALEPRVSAVIIQEHVTDGIEMARTFRLPPEVVEGIATHHGTTLVSYFYRRAVQASSEESVDQQHYRYKGRKPSSKEMAILMLADCCEGASRAAAQNNRNLSKVDLEEIVRGLVADRVEDGQLDASELTFRELRTVQESFIEALVGVYHPRIAYPAAPGAAIRPATGAAEENGASRPAPELPESVSHGLWPADPQRPADPVTDPAPDPAARP